VGAPLSTSTHKTAFPPVGGFVRGPRSPLSRNSSLPGSPPKPP